MLLEYLEGKACPVPGSLKQLTNVKAPTPGLHTRPVACGGMLEVPELLELLDPLDVEVVVMKDEIVVAVDCFELVVLMIVEVTTLSELVVDLLELVEVDRHGLEMAATCMRSSTNSHDQDHTPHLDL